MKKLAILILGLVSLSLASCHDESYAEGFVAHPKEPTQPQQPKDSIVPPTIDWSAEVEKSFGYDQATGKWPSKITLHKTNGRDTTFVANCPMTSTISAPAEIIVDPATAATIFVNVDPTVKLDSTEWYRESDGYYYRTITRQQVVHMSTYDATITSTHVEAKMAIDGKEIYFLHGQEPAPTKKGFNTLDAGGKERYGKNYSVEECNLALDHHLHGLYHVELEAETRVLREITSPDLEPEPEMPTPDLKVSAYGNVNNITFSPEFQGNNVIWHKVCLTRNTINGKEYFSIWVDGSFKRTVELNSGESNEKYNSAYLADGTWVPAILKYSSAGDGGWDYTFVVNGNVGMKTIDQNMALMSGLSNFKKDNNAAQTPGVYTTTSVKEYGSKKLVTVNGYNKDNRPVISFTIGECL